MKRLTERQYQRHVSVTMLVYVASMVLVWPLARTTSGLGLKIALAAVPALPMLYVIALMARKVAQSDEFEQRIHLVALGVASAVLAALSLTGGLLAAAGAVPLDGSILIWVFPVMMVTYSLTRWWVITRRYGGSTECEQASVWSLPLRLLLVAALMGVVLLAAWWRGRLDDLSLGLLAGLGSSSLLLAVIESVRRWRRVRRERAGAPGTPQP
ncbi:hypothetical protein ISP17_17905 [Dyella ginsengisoli]|jgi:hypothetical protein|uniref:Transmembrane protein n=1 Tax=Dyella ginsengisoli TaxID=363848 RepID=A0ABW8JXE6_9GAMM